MPKSTLSALVRPAMLAITWCLLTTPDIAAAQAVRYIAAGGSNANNCQRATPCQTLQRGINVTPAGGELVILDSGAYGNAATITKSISISAVDVAAIVGNITVNAPGADVTLRGLTMNGASAGGPNGLVVTTAASVQVIDCLIERFDSRGIFVTATAAQIFVKGTTVRRNPIHGILINIGSTFLTIDDSAFESNGTGIYVAGNLTRATITNTTVSGNSSNGITNVDAEVGIDSSTVTNNGAGGISCNGTVGDQLLMVSNTVIRGNGTYGVTAFGPCKVTVSDSVISNNGQYGLRLLGSSRSTVVGTTVSLNALPGIRCEESAEIGLDASTIALNGAIGLDCQASNFVGLSRNYFHGQPTGAVSVNSTHTAGDSLFYQGSGLTPFPNIFTMERD